jgi:hypothetical protein
MNANSVVTVLPNTYPPAWRILSTTWAFFPGWLPTNAGDPISVGKSVGVEEIFHAHRDRAAGHARP